MMRRRAAREGMARSALAKQARGEKPTVREIAELERWKEQKEEETVRRWLGELPARLFKELSGGKAASQIKEQAQTHRLPMDGASVDMFAFTAAVFDLLARNKYRLMGPDDEDPLLSGVASPWLERYREERARMVRLERQEKEGRLIDRDQIHEMFSVMAEINRRTGKKLERDFGTRALEIFNDGFKSAERQADRVFK